MQIINIGDYYLVQTSADRHRFPDIDQVFDINSDSLREVHVNASHIDEALDQLAPFTPSTNQIVWHLALPIIDSLPKLKNPVLTISAADGGDRKADYEIEELDWKYAENGHSYERRGQMKFGMNYKYIQDALDTLGKKNSICIRAEELNGKRNDGPTYWFTSDNQEEAIIIMPMRIG